MQDFNSRRRRISELAPHQMFQQSGLQLLPMLIWIYSQKHHNFFKSAISCPVPRPIQLLTKFEHHPHPANQSQLGDNNMLSLIRMLIALSHLGVARDVENHTLLRLSPQPLPLRTHAPHSYKCFTFSLYPYLCPPLMNIHTCIR